MAIEVINNGETGLVVRGKINDNFSELASFVDAGTLPLANPPSGDEKLFGLQGGLSKYFTPQQLSPSAIIQAYGYRRKMQQSFTGLTHTPPLFAGVNQGMFGNEPLLCHLGNGGTVGQPDASAWFGRRGLALCGLSTNSASYAGVSSTNFPFYPTATGVNWYFGAVAGLTALPVGGNQSFYIGVTPPPLNGVPTDGFYFQGSAANANWIATLNGTAQSDTDTGFVIAPVNALSTNAAWLTFEILSLGADPDVKFYIDRTLVASVSKTVGSYYPSYAASHAGAYCAQRGQVVANNMLIDAIHTSMEIIDASAYGFSTGLL
jgi:hypothetical protein